MMFVRLDGMAPSPIRPPCVTPVLPSRHPRLHPVPVLSVGISTLRMIQSYDRWIMLYMMRIQLWGKFCWVGQRCGYEACSSYEVVKYSWKCIYHFVLSKGLGFT
ncbi:hypothetical protein HanOQP8_Chr14g0532351 [Helianthus annuus]|nr:hypothetical protein HanOQP8_Chr14g0532351 [Helianthus annuus]